MVYDFKFQIANLWWNGLSSQIHISYERGSEIRSTLVMDGGYVLPDYRVTGLTD